MTSPAVVMAPRADGFEVVWGVSRLSRGWVEWQHGDENGVINADAFGLVPQGDRVLRVRVTGFTPGSHLSIRAITESIAGRTERHESAWKRVRTLNSAASTAHIAVWNDTHQRGRTIRALDKVTPAVDLLVWNGDLCNDWNTPDTFTRTILSPEGRDISADRPTSIVLGNHDVRGEWAYQLAEFVATPEGRPYSVGRIGPVAFVMMHTGEDKPDDHSSFDGRVAFDQLRAEQAAWLQEATARPGIRDAPYRLVFCHIPLRWVVEDEVDYDNGGYDWFSRRSRDAWHESLTAWGAQLVISGHTHRSAFLPATDEFPYAQLVGGGPARSARSREAAAWTEITADADVLTTSTRRLNGTLVFETHLTPIGAPPRLPAF